MTKKYEKEHTPFTIRVESDIWKVFHMILKAQGTNPTRVIRGFVIQYIKDHKDDIFNAVAVIKGFDIEDIPADGAEDDEVQEDVKNDENEVDFSEFRCN